MSDNTSPVDGSATTPASPSDPTQSRTTTDYRVALPSSPACDRTEPVSQASQTRPRNASSNRTATTTSGLTPRCGSLEIRDESIPQLALDAQTTETSNLLTTTDRAGSSQSTRLDDRRIPSQAVFAAASRHAGGYDRAQDHMRSIYGLPDQHRAVVASHSSSTPHVHVEEQQHDSDLDAEGETDDEYLEQSRQQPVRGDVQHMTTVFDQSSQFALQPQPADTLQFPQPPAPGSYATHQPYHSFSASAHPSPAPYNTNLLQEPALNFQPSFVAPQTFYHFGQNQADQFTQFTNETQQAPAIDPALLAVALNGPDLEFARLIATAPQASGQPFVPLPDMQSMQTMTTPAPTIDQIRIARERPDFNLLAEHGQTIDYAVEGSEMLQLARLLENPDLEHSNTAPVRERGPRRGAPRPPNGRGRRRGRGRGAL